MIVGVGVGLALRRGITFMFWDRVRIYGKMSVRPKVGVFLVHACMNLDLAELRGVRVRWRRRRGVRGATV